jgi:hypothetical protein
MSDRNYLEESLPCPKCGFPDCVLEVTVSQERENTCPACGEKFTDAHEQFPPMVMHGLYYEGGEETSPPVALFESQVLLDEFVKYLKKSEDDDDRHLANSTVSMDTTVYGAYWNSSEPNPYGDKPIPFTPEHLPRQPSGVGTANVTATGMDRKWPIRMSPEMLIGDWQVYFCGNDQRWYMFVRMPGDKLEVVSINSGPGNFARIYMAGMKAAILTAERNTLGGLLGTIPQERITPLTWEQFVAAGGKLDIPDFA